MHGDTAWRQEPGPHLWHEELPKGYVYRAAGPQGTMLPERALSDLWGQDSASFEAFCKIWVPLAYGAAEGDQVCHVLRAHVEPMSEDESEESDEEEAVVEGGEGGQQACMWERYSLMWESEASPPPQLAQRPLRAPQSGRPEAATAVRPVPGATALQLVRQQRPKPKARGPPERREDPRHGRLRR